METAENQSMQDDESIKEDKKENTIMNGDNISSTAASSQGKKTQTLRQLIDLWAETEAG